MDEAAFLEALLARPTDRAIQAAYADWLAVAGDPRGELIRIESNMQGIPAFSNQFWELKLVRNRLRAQAAPEWLAALGFGIDCHPVFAHGFPDGWKERWRVIREFTERWRRIPIPDVGGQKEEVARAEARLGRALPPSVQEWVALAYDLGRPPFVFRDCCTMDELGGLDAISILRLCEGEHHWGIRHADLHLPDPPVYGFSYSDDDFTTFEPASGEPLAASLTDFVIDYALCNTRGAGGSLGCGVSDPEQLFLDLESSFPVSCQVGPSRVFERDNILVLTFPMEVRRWDQVSVETQLSVELARPLPSESIPAFIWDYAQGGGYFSGLFCEEHEKRSASRKAKASN